MYHKAEFVFDVSIDINSDETFKLTCEDQYRQWEHCVGEFQYLMHCTTRPLLPCLQLKLLAAR